MNLVWSDFSHESENSQKMIRAKQSGGTDYWPIMREVFAHDCATLPLSRFRLWASVHNVPLVTQYRTAKFFGAAFDAAFKDETIYNALVENWVGIPDVMTGELRIMNDFDTSVQRIQNVAHLVLTGYTPKILSKLDSIIEIGAGYGDMCSVIHDMGFKGKYTIVDIPEVQPIQDYYLKKNGINAEFKFEADDMKPADLVLSTWALSETPLDYRARLMPQIFDSKKWLILYQAKIFGQEVNDSYFRGLFKNKNHCEFTTLNTNAWDGDNTYMVIH